jgi:PAS domain S-box-containing protein
VSSGPVRDPEASAGARPPAPHAFASLPPPEARLRLLFENTPSAIALHELVLDADGRPVDYVFLEVNAAFERQTGLARDAILGRRVTEVLPGIERDPADWIGTYGRVALGGAPIRFEQCSAALGRWYDVTAYSPARGYFGVIFTDVTEHRRLADALRESEARYRARSRDLGAILDATHAQLALLDPELRFVLVNDAYEAACGHARAELIGRGHFEFFPNAENEAIFRRVAATGVPFHVDEKPFRFADQPERGVTYWNWSLVPVKDEGGAVQGVLLSLLDVTANVEARATVERLATERQRAADALREEGELRERFMAILGHDLRLPITVARTSAQMMLRRGGKPPDPALERVVRATRTMESLVRMVLGTSLLRSGQGIPIALAPTDAGELCRRSVDDALAFAPERQIRLVADGDLSVRWDAERVAEALGNVIVNALTHGDAAAPVRVSVRGAGDAVEIAVANAGPAIPPRALETLFEPFSRGPREGPGRAGIGLGLYIVREIARAHGGSIDVSSEEAETVFTFRLPRAPPAPGR